MNYDKNKWIYKCNLKDEIRYVLGIKGKKTLLCFGVNPSTAKPEELDNTLKSVDRLTINNEYDSWIMMNLYPQRATDPNNIHEKIDNEIHRINLYHIKDILSKTNADIWAAWGTLIEKRPFFIDCLKDIYKLTQDYNCKWLTIGKESKFGHPHHPLYLNSKEHVKQFDIDDYMKKLNNLKKK